MLQSTATADAGNGQLAPVPGIGDAAVEDVTATDSVVVFSKSDIMCDVGATSGSKSGASMKAGLEGLAQQVAGQV